VKDGKAPPNTLVPLMQSIRDYQNPYNQPNAKRTSWLKEFYTDIKSEYNMPEEQLTDSLLFVGCSPLRDSAAENIPRVVLKLLLKAGVNIGLLGDQEKCCGNPSLRIGDQDEFIAFAKENIKQFNNWGVKKLICICPFCYSTLRRDYPEVGEDMNFDVIHILDYISQLIENGNIVPKKRRQLTVTYHDPCHLGRISGAAVSGTGAFNGVYQSPRNIIQSIPGIKLTEMKRIKDDSFCCGAGSWMKVAYPDFAAWTAATRIEEAKSTGAETLVTFCPHCEENLDNTITGSQYEMKIYNLLQLLLEST